MKDVDKTLEKDLIGFKKRLDNQIKYSKAVVDMINLPTEKEQREFIDTLFQNDFKCYQNTMNGFSTEQEILALIMGARAQKLQALHPNYKPLLILHNSALEFMKMLCNKAVDGATVRFDTLCQLSMSSIHVTACSFFVSPREVECIYLDPSRSEYNIYELDKWITPCKLEGVNFKLHGYQPTDTTQTLQQGKYECGIYAESLLRKMHRMDFAALKLANPNSSNFMDLNPCFMKYTQSISVLDSYVAQHTEAQLGFSKKYSFEELRERYFKKTLRKTDMSYLVYSPQNRALDITRLSSVNKAKQFVDTHSGLELINLLGTLVYTPNRS